MRSRFLWFFLLVGILIILSGCGQRSIEPEWLEVQDFLCQLQRAVPARIGETAFDLVVVSFSATGSSPEVIPALKDSPWRPQNRALLHEHWASREISLVLAVRIRHFLGRNTCSRLSERLTCQSCVVGDSMVAS